MNREFSPRRNTVPYSKTRSTKVCISNLECLTLLAVISRYYSFRLTRVSTDGLLFVRPALPNEPITKNRRQLMLWGQKNRRDLPNVIISWVFRMKKFHIGKLAQKIYAILSWHPTLSCALLFVSKALSFHMAIPNYGR